MQNPTILCLGRFLPLIAVFSFGLPTSAQMFSRDVSVDVFVNQVGFTPKASKQCVLKGTSPRTFEVVRTDTLEVVLSGLLAVSNGDFGTFLVGDFSEVKEPGKYCVKAGDSRSFPFEIAIDVYDEAISLIVNYFALQRCGPSTTGYLTPCHCDDAVRMDNGKHQESCCVV